MTAEEYRALLDTDFSDVDIEDLTDVRKIKIDKNLPQEKRQAQYLKQVGNPYLLRRGSMMIKGGCVVWQERVEKIRRLQLQSQLTI